MLLWFVGTSWLAVWFVFRDERFDYRMLTAGALVPDLVDAAAPGRPFHSVMTGIVVLGVAMVATRRRAAARRWWLAAAIGMFLHLVFDGAFARTAEFWWPLGGPIGETQAVPWMARPATSIALEVLGALMLYRFGRAHGLVSREGWAVLWRTGCLGGSVGAKGRAGRC